MSAPTQITIRGACEHNLDNIDVDLPRNALVVFTGVSGSGKSSLAFDTIYQEGQRRFMESLSSYARQFLGQMERPRVERVDGVSPTLSIDQKTVNRNPRSTVGTVTDLYDHLRLLMARLGTPHCPVCGTEVSRLAVDQVVDDLIDTCAGQRALVLGPVVRDRKGEYRKEMADLLQDGWLRARIDGVMVELSEPPTLARYEKHTLEVVVDRLRIDGSDRDRLAEALETASRLGLGTLGLHFPDGGDDRVYSTERGCPNHPQVSIPELEPRLFSFNAPQGACGGCNGLGVIEAFDVDLVVDRNQKGSDCYQCFNADDKLPFAHFNRGQFDQVLGALKAPKRKKVADWPLALQERLIFGDPELILKLEIDRGARTEVRERPWRGLLPMVEMVWKYTGHTPLEKFRERRTCEDCGGLRLNPVAQAVTFRGRPITDFSGMSVAQAHDFFAELVLDDTERDVGEQLLVEIRERLSFLYRVGLTYLTLDRSAASLSGGEAQRIRLAAQVGSALEGVTYVLDEPSIGLHSRDNRRLLDALIRLRDRGNSVLVVEHDEETILAADWVVDIGPGAGREGGRLMASGPPAELMRSAESVTAAWLRGDRVIDLPKRRDTAGSKLSIIGARVNNLQGVDVDVPLGTLTVVTGVSGSGKSSFVFEALEKSWRSIDGGGGPVCCDQILGADQIDKLIRISQTPIGRTPRSNPATYTKVFDTIRTLFAAAPESKARAYKKGRFSFNVSGGRCEDCQGAGVKVVEMQFLPSVTVGCETCQGRRFNAETLEITWRSKTIYDVLQMTVAEAAEFFERVPKVKRILGTMVEVGLGYVPLGQPSTTLSGGEAQRVKLATELHRPATGNTLYLLDEPTTGLHFEDVAKLLAALQRLVDAGNTVLVIEHHSDLIKCADHLIDMGPEGGDGGGQLIGFGTPEDIAQLDTPTGHVLAGLSQIRDRLKLPALAAEAVLQYHPAAARTGPSQISIRGARKHNLRSVDVDLPHNKISVITGVSGSGKSSLAFDTLFAEGQRQYVESLSTYARRFLGRLERAPVESVSGLLPAIAIDQRGGGHNPRSTVATVTEIHDVLRLLWARVGVPHCPQCDRVVTSHPPSNAAGTLSAQSGAGWLYTALRPVTGDLASRRDGLVRDGWVRLLDLSEATPTQVDLETDEALRLLAAGAYLVVDRFDPSKVNRARISEAFATAYRIGASLAWFRGRKASDAIHFTEHATCSEHGVVHESELTPRHFSFNSQLGACVRCGGLGQARAIMVERLLAQPKEGVWDALDPRVASVLRRSPRNRALVNAVLEVHGLTEKSPVTKWSPAVLKHMLHGGGMFTLAWTQSWGTTKRNVQEERDWPGVVGILSGWKSKLDWLHDQTTCPDCAGGRLRPSLLSVRVASQGIDDFAAASVSGALKIVQGWNLGGARGEIAERPKVELERRLGFLEDVGLGYLALDRAADTLSGGEAQRIRLASQLGSRLTGVVYVLDEPTVGLHPRDTQRLLKTLGGLRDLGNSVVMVEHDTQTIEHADYVVDMGPAAGLHGGQVVATGTPDELRANPDSLTGRWLSGALVLPLRKKRRKARSKLVLKGARTNNLQGLNVNLPTGVWIGVSGVSGSGKSSLIMDTLAPALQGAIGANRLGADHDSLTLGEKVDRVVVVNQSPIGRSPRSTPATYCGIMDALRTLYSQVPGARARGWKPGRFSFNSPKGGRCVHCEGRGSILVEMHFLPDVWVVCDSCRGRRYGRETLEVRFKDKSIADVLAMRADEALELFKAQRRLKRPLQALVDVGLGYLTLGQPGTTLSGGEAQRVKLASELTSRKGHCVYILDEPTTGLHLDDVARLVAVLHQLVDAGHTVLTIEHHLDILFQVDHLIDLGPEGGTGGGQLIGQGAPAKIAKLATPTGVALAEYLRRARG